MRCNVGDVITYRRRFAGSAWYQGRVEVVADTGWVAVLVDGNHWHHLDTTDTERNEVRQVAR